MSYSDFPIDPDMIISKVLSKSDIVGNMSLPKSQVLSVFTKMNNITYANLLNGIEVKVLDTIENDLYTVTLKCVEDMSKFYFGSGWSTMKYSLDLSEGDVLQLYWDYLANTFIVLNFPYSLIM
ncbi:unnamed protein product [Cochlearia groenlandica]